MGKWNDERASEECCSSEMASTARSVMQVLMSLNLLFALYFWVVPIDKDLASHTKHHSISKQKFSVYKFTINNLKVLLFNYFALPIYVTI